MPSVSLPDDASLEQLRKQAKDVRDLARAGVPGALDLVAEHHPKGAHPVPLTRAQLRGARHYRFAPRARLVADPALPSREGGPYGWEPVLSLASARHDPRISQEAALGTARALLEHGADPNAGYLWHGLYPPYT